MKIKCVTIAIMFCIQSLFFSTIMYSIYSEVIDPFFNSISRGNNSYFDQLLKSEHNNPKRLNEALICASRDGRPKMVTKLLAAGAKINYEKCGWSPLMYAILKERKEMVKQLRSQGAQDLTEIQLQRMSGYLRAWYKEEKNQIK